MSRRLSEGSSRFARSGRVENIVHYAGMQGVKPAGPDSSVWAQIAPHSAAELANFMLERDIGSDADYDTEINVTDLPAMAMIAGEDLGPRIMALYSELIAEE